MAAWKQVRSNRLKRTTALRANRPSRALSQGQQLDRLRKWLLPSEEIFADLRLHGNTNWAPAALVWLALCWGWGESKNVTDAFQAARAQCRLMNVAPIGTYQGFMHALVAWTDRLMQLLWPVLHRRMERIGGAFWQIGGWTPIALDGSRSSVPRTDSNEKALCAANYGTGKTARYRKRQTKGMRRRKNEQNKPQAQEPQVWTTLMWHMGLRLPWMWRLGPSNSSERAHALEMIEGGDFPKSTLFCGDAGFVGYPFWERIVSRGCHFLVRVGSNIRLLSQTADSAVEKGGIVLCWPKRALQSGRPPLRLRLVKVQIGKTPMWMLTSVLQASKLTKTRIVEFYKMRWGIEVEFRGLKQTLDRAQLRCRNNRRVLVELNWSIMAMAVAELFALKEQLRPSRAPATANSTAATPKTRSLSQTLRALRSCLNQLTQIPAAGEDLRTRLRLAVTDGYTRKISKHARYRPPNPDKNPLGDPKIRRLRTHEKKILNQLTLEKLAA